jgi:formate-dependent nitrite reductase membrane component NrfD
LIELRDPVLNTALHLWGWEVAVYLFLGGLASGLLIFSSWAHLAGRRREYYPAVRVATLWTPPIILVGLVFLWLDLGSKWNPFWLYLTFRPLSPMSWGAWILLAVLVTSSLAAVPVLAARGAWLWRRSGTGLNRLARWVGPRVRALSWWNLGLGVALGVYTGVLLGTMVARPALNSPLLGPLFLVSGASTAAALIVILAPGGPWGRLLTRAEVAVHILKLSLLGLYLVGLATSAGYAQAAAAMLVTGAWAWTFWPVVVVAGVLVPLGIALAEIITHRANRALALLSGPMVLAGGLTLRIVLVYAGQRGL